MQPKNWPPTLAYSPVSQAKEMAIDIVYSLLFPPIDNKRCELFASRSVHPDVAIKVLEPPHLLADLPTTLGHKNRGLFATSRIAQGSVIGEYTGLVELLPKTFKNTDKRACTDYLWTVEHRDFIFKVDGTFGSNEIAMINDYRNIAEKENVEACFMPHESLHFFCYKAIRDIEEGEELLVDFGENFFTHLKG